MFLNKYKETVFGLAETDNNSSYIDEIVIGWIGGMDGGWTIFGIYDGYGWKIYPFFGIFVIHLKQ